MTPGRSGRLLIVALLLALPVRAPGEPLVRDAAGDFRQGASGYVLGAGFGVKQPAAPLVWDDGSSNPPPSTYYDEVLPTAAQQGSQYNMAYRRVPFRGIDAPHPHGLLYILGGAHATNSIDAQYLSGNNVSIGKNLSSFRYFAQYWYRVDPSFDEENNAIYGDNMKELCLSSAPGQIYGGEWGYYNWCNNLVPDVNYRGAVRLNRLGADCPAAAYGCSADPYAVTHNSPINGWIKMQWEGDYDTTYDNPTVRLTTYPDGAVTDLDHYGNPITTFETIYGCGYPRAGEIRFLGLGGYARVPRLNNGVNSFRYFAGVYIDSTRARITLGDSQDYASCTVMEPQIPTAWSDGRIDFRVNLGALPDTGTAYLFVFDAYNAHNPRGYPVPLGGSPEPDTTPPAPPGGMRVVIP